MMHEQHVDTEEIARRAYSLFLARGGEHGHDVEDWNRAEADVRREQAGSAQPAAPVTKAAAAPAKTTRSRKAK